MLTVQSKPPQFFSIWHIAAILWLGGLCSTLQAEPSPQKIILNHADTLRSRGESRELIGNVKVTRGETVIHSENALYEPQLGRIVLTGHVKMTDPARTVVAQVIRYNEKSGDFEAAGDVDMTAGDSLRIRCRNARFTDRTKIAELEDGIIIDILRDGSRITGGYGVFNTNDSSGVIEENPVYRLPDKENDDSTKTTDTLTIVSRKLQFSRKDQSAVFTGDVKMTKGDVLAVADSLFHLPDSGKSRLSGAPMIWRGKEELSGHSIEIAYRGNDLSQIIVIGKAVALTPAHDDDQRRNRLAGDQLTLETPNDSTRIVTAIGSATGWYNVWDQKEGYKGVNVAAADRIQLVIENDKTNSIKLEGKTSGAFYPPGSEPMETSDTSVKKMDGIGWGEI